jgi:hypothetical protein
MYISHKSNVLQQFHETEWNCRRRTKGLDKSEYWTWLDSVTSGDPPVADYSGETGYTIVECTDEDVQARLEQLSDYQSSSLEIGTVYNIKWQDDIGNAEEILDDDGKSQSPKVYVQSHFVPDDSAKDARILADEWTQIRRERDRLLADTDWMTCSDSPTMSAGNKTYRQKLRDLPSDQKDETTYADITWPTKP